jgi:methionyl-tRNA formyltransferase
LKILFAGTPANAARTLEDLVDAGHTVVGVLTRSDAATGRSATVTESPVATAASALGIPTYKSNLVDGAVLDWITAQKPDLGVIVAFGCILRRNALEIPVKGWINLHYSLLPKYPGATPVQQALLEGAEITGVTVFELDEGVDSGPVLAAETVEILPEENSGSLLERLTGTGSKLLIQTLDNFDDLQRSSVIQDSEARGAVTRKITRLMARLDFNVSASEFVNKVRALNPEPVAWFELESLAIRVLEASVFGTAEVPKGLASLVESELVVGCLKGSVLLKTVQPAGKKAMSGADWFRGLHKDSLLLS